MRCGWLVFSMFLATSAAAANFSVTPVRIYMKTQDRAVAVTIQNEGGAPVVLQADLYVWSQKADGSDDMALTEDLILSPPIIKLAANAKQVVRLARLKPADASRQLTYRMILREVPEAGPQKDNIQVPIALGNAEICFPERAITELSATELGAVIAHEFAHLRRRDNQWLTAIAILEALLFVQPLNRLASEKLRAIAECSCDDWAVDCIRDPEPLATAVVRAAGWIATARAPIAAIGIASTQSVALIRVRRILNPTRPQRRSDRLSLALAVAALPLAVLLAPGAAARLTTISAYDDGGPFTLTLNRGNVVSMTLDGGRVAASNLERDGHHLRVRDRGQLILDLTLDQSGGFRWKSRPPRIPSNN